MRINKLQIRVHRCVVFSKYNNHKQKDEQQSQKIVKIAHRMSVIYKRVVIPYFNAIFVSFMLTFHDKRGC